MRYKLTAKQKSHVIDYLQGSISRDDLAYSLKMTSQGIYTLCTSILKYVVQSGKEVQEALNDY